MIIQIQIQNKYISKNIPSYKKILNTIYNIIILNNISTETQVYV